MCSLRHVASSPSACHENSSQKPFALLIIEPGALTSWSLLFALLIVRILSATSGGSRYLAYLVPTFNLVFVARRPPCSDIYLIFSPGVHFQLGGAPQSRRLSLLSIEIVGRFKGNGSSAIFQRGVSGDLLSIWISAKCLDIRQISGYQPSIGILAEYRDIRQVWEYQPSVSGYQPSIWISAKYWDIFAPISNGT